ncbi:MAG: CPBP family intramembrane metalloprotease [Deltaproteobacteria bacterium]|nr:CPBP family intramembrane metalloprotease [Deltaproteobacteria bacterium]
MEEKKKKKKSLEELLWRWFLIIFGIALIQELQRWPTFKNFNLEMTASFLFLSTLFLINWTQLQKKILIIFIFLSSFLLFLFLYTKDFLPYPLAKWNIVSVLILYSGLILGLLLSSSKQIFFEKHPSQLLKSLLWFIVLSTVVFPLLIWLNHYFQDWFFHRRYILRNNFSLEATFFQHFFFIALPEEFFFRGYLQEQLNKIYGRPFKLLGAQVGHGLWICSAIFALSHSLIALQWWHFAIFFPAMAFGWLREKTGAITSSALFHAASNTFAIWVGYHYL